MSLSHAMILSRVRWSIDAARVSVALLRLGLVLRGFDPNQPRVPAGSSEGGEWTGRNGGNTVSLPSDVPRRYAQLDAGRLPSIDLHDEEARGGHTLRKHVGKTDEYLLDVVRRDRVKTFLHTISRIGLGFFADENDAKYLVNQTIDMNSEIIKNKLNKDEDFMVQHRFGFVTGREAFRPAADADPYIQQTYEVRVILRPDPGRQRGYGVITAFPVNRDPKPR